MSYICTTQVRDTSRSTSSTRCSMFLLLSLTFHFLRIQRHRWAGRVRRIKMSLAGVQRHFQHFRSGSPVTTALSVSAQQPYQGQYHVHVPPIPMMADLYPYRFLCLTDIWFHPLFLTLGLLLFGGICLENRKLATLQTVGHAEPFP